MSYRKHLMTMDETPSELYKATEVGTNLAEVGTDLISRTEAIEDVKSWEAVDGREKHLQKNVVEWLKELPSAQPERRCVNCGRTVNNGGWYEDGRTRCPIEEHYALPKDGYCHLWEKRKDWEDDYVKRAEEGEK